MSENENQSPEPSKQTSSVPLKKETVRVTLKAADAPPAVPSATIQAAPPVRPPVPMAPPTPTVGGAPRPPAPAPTIPLRTAGPSPTPTVPIRPVGPATMAPAPTIRLASSTPTRPSLPGSGPTPTIALPKATMQLQTPTLPLGTSPVSAAPMATKPAAIENEDEESDTSAVVTVLSGLGLVAALVVLTFQLVTANTWVSAPENEGQGWSALFS
jgi:hypothetical protein